MGISYLWKTCVLCAASIAVLSTGPGLDAKPEGPRAPKKIALLVGISNYRQGTNSADGWSSLDTGPDLENLSRVLRDHYEFAVGEPLREADATQAGIVAAFRSQLVGRAQPGDAVLFYFTGHGHQVIDEPGGDAEPDGLDEALVTWVPKEKQSLPTGQRSELMYLRDDTLNTLLRELTAKMKGSSGKVEGTVTVILDSCHSGSGTKGSAIPKGRPWNEEIDGPRPKGQTEPRGGGWDVQEGLPEGSVVISGCQSGQFSYMLSPNEGSGSALTFFLCRVLTEAAQRELNRDLSYRGVFEEVSVRVQGARPNQNPQLEGVLDALLFGDGSVKNTEKYYRATKVTVGPPAKVTLSAGSLSGLTVGSVLDLCAAGSDVSVPANRIALAKVESVDPFSSVATVTSFVKSGATAENLTAARAVLKEFVVPVEPLRVKIGSDHPLYKTVSGFKFIDLSGVTEENFDLRFSSKEESLEFQRKTGAFRQLKSVGEDDIRAGLLAEWRRQELARLSAPPGSPRVELDMVAVPAGTRLAAGSEIESGVGKSPKRTLDGAVLMEPGDEAYLVCRNSSGSNLFVTILYLRLDGAINVWPSNPFAQQAIAGDGKTRVLARIAGVSEPFGTEIVKLIATERQVDLSGLAMEAATRGTNKGPDHPLRDLLLGFQDGVPKTAGMGDFGDVWTVSEILLTTKAK